MFNLLNLSTKFTSPSCSLAVIISKPVLIYQNKTYWSENLIRTLLQQFEKPRKKETKTKVIRVILYADDTILFAKGKIFEWAWLRNNFISSHDITSLAACYKKNESALNDKKTGIILSVLLSLILKIEVNIVFLGFKLDLNLAGKVMYKPWKSWHKWFSYWENCWKKFHL